MSSDNERMRIYEKIGVFRVIGSSTLCGLLQIATKPTQKYSQIVAMHRHKITQLVGLMYFLSFVSIRIGFDFCRTNLFTEKNREKFQNKKWVINQSIRRETLKGNGSTEALHTRSNSHFRRHTENQSIQVPFFFARSYFGGFRVPFNISSQHASSKFLFQCLYTRACNAYLLP